MKQIILLLAIFSFTLSMAQAPQGMVKIDYQENKYSEAAENAATITDAKYQEDLKAYANRLAAIRDTHFPGARQMYIIPSSGYETNDPVLEKIVDNFYDGAKYYYIDYYKQKDQLKRVDFVKADRYFIAEFSEDGSTLKLNSQLADKENEALLWTIIYNQFGQLYGLKLEKNGHGIMSSHWELDQDHVKIANYRRKHNKNEREDFFKALQKKAGLKKKI